PGPHSRSALVPRGRRRNRWIGPIGSCASLCRLPREGRRTLSPASSPSSSRKSGASKSSSRTGEAPAPISAMKWSPGPIPMVTRCCLPPHPSRSTAVFTAHSATIRLRILRRSPSFPGFHCFSHAREKQCQHDTECKDEKGLERIHEKNQRDGRQERRVKRDGF